MRYYFFPLCRSICKYSDEYEYMYMYADQYSTSLFRFT